MSLRLRLRLPSGPTNISVAPEIVAFSDNGDHTDDDLHLTASSPCIDVASDAIIYGVVDDYDDVARPVDGDVDGYERYDMGAFEYVP